MCGHERAREESKGKRARDGVGVGGGEREREREWGKRGATNVTGRERVAVVSLVSRRTAFLFEFACFGGGEGTGFTTCAIPDVGWTW